MGYSDPGRACKLAMSWTSLNGTRTNTTTTTTAEQFLEDFAIVIGKYEFI